MQYNRDAVAFGKFLSEVAQSRKWAFERRCGDLIAGLCQAVEGWDMLLVAYRATYRSRGPVVVVAPQLDASQRAVEPAGELALSLGTGPRSIVLLPGRAVVMPGQAAPELFEGAAALVIDISAGPLGNVEELRRQHMAARCSMIMLGAARGDAPPGHGG